MTGRLLRFALLADGRSDRALIPIIKWTLRQVTADLEFPEPVFETHGRTTPMREQMQRLVELSSPDILFVHRDAEKAPHSKRLAEIPRMDGALVRIVPVRMTEAWLLHDEEAIREAAGNPHGTQPLGLPPTTRVEALPDPKEALHQALRRASNHTGRRLRRFQHEVAKTVHRVADLIVDWSALQSLPAFRAFESECRSAIAGL